VTDRPGIVGGTRLDRFSLPLLLALAALMRLPNLAARGSWEADQGRDMLILRTMVRDGVVPLVGPQTSIGDLHHGPWYYYFLSPAAAVTGGDSPLAVVALIALAGIATVGVVWWLARGIAGPVAGAAAGLTAAVSVAAIEGSTVIWSPVFIALSSALAVAGTWRAWSGGDRRWWLLAALGVALTMQFHVLGVALLPVVAIPYVIDARRRRLRWVHLGVLAIFGVAYLPLLVNELTTSESELRAALEYLAGGGGGGGTTAIPVVFAIVGLRVLSWPLTGLITDGFIAGVVGGAVVIAIAVWRARASGPDRLAARWLGMSLVWSTAFLTLAAPSLATVVPGLPNDHYHAFTDPMVFTLVGLGVAALAAVTARTDPPARRLVGPIVAAVGVLALVSWNLGHLPPAIHPDGGFPAAEQAGSRVEAALADAGIGSEEVLRIRSLPDFKSSEAMAYPLVRAGRVVVADTPAGIIVHGGAAEERQPGALVLLCDDRFREAIGAGCGGPAEATITPEGGGPAWGPLLDRFEASPDRFVSVYGPPENPG
jgi:4-amino-4-deoxy-L-arabinose transferase-like glycosyltransferase